MDTILQILFNTNHEMPSGWVLVGLVVFTLAAQAFMRYLQEKREKKK